MVRKAAMAVSVAVATFGLASCAGTAIPDTFEIAAPKAAQASAARSRAQILIPEPTALKTLDSEKIVVRPSPYSVQYLGNSQWSDRLPRMVQLRLLQAFENTGRIGAVGVPGQGLAIDYQLVLEVRKFEIDATGSPQANVEISVKALNDRNGSVRQSQIFRASVPVAGTANADYVAALNAAFSQVSAQIVTWTLRLI